MTINLIRFLAKNLSLFPAIGLVLFYFLTFQQDFLIDIPTYRLIFYGLFVWVILLYVTFCIEIIRGRFFWAFVITTIWVILSDFEFSKSLILISSSINSILSPVLSPVIPVILTSFGIPFAFLYWLQTRHIVTSEEYPKKDGITAGSYIGQPAVLNKALQIVKLLNSKIRHNYEEAGGDRLNGVLLVGLHGSGKTHLVRVIAAEANLTLFYIDVSSLRSVFWIIARSELARIYSAARAEARRKGAAIVCLANFDLLNLHDYQTSNEDKGSSVLDNLISNSDSNLLSAIKNEMSSFNVERSIGMGLRREFNKITRQAKPLPSYVLTVGEITNLNSIPASLRKTQYFGAVIDIPPLNHVAQKQVVEFYLSLMPHNETITASFYSKIVPCMTPEGVKAILNAGLRNAVANGRTYLSIEDFDDIRSI